MVKQLLWLSWLWPAIIILSTIATGLVTFVITETTLRPFIVLWFLCVCPGMALVCFLRLAEWVEEWVLAIALSFAVDALVAGILLYAGRWSPTAILGILMGISLGGAIMQIGFSVSWQGVWPRIAFSRKLGQAFVVLASLLSPGIRLGGAIKQRGLSVSLQTLAHDIRPRIALSRKLSLALVVLASMLGLGIGVDSLSHAPSLPAAHSTTPAPTVVRSTPTSGPAATTVSSSSIYPRLTGTYNGTIFDLKTNVSTTITLNVSRQSQGSFSGFLVLGSKLQGSGPVSGTIDTAKNLQFIVMDAAGNATFFYEGAMQSATSLSGDYYQCLPGPPQRGQCSKAPGSYGIWNVQLG